ncbi:unnamed protein product [Phaeothamnion confervicola]
MVIVTTAVYWGLNSQLRHCCLTGPLNLPAPGRSQSVYIVLQLRTDLCFYYGGILPSSLTMVLSIALVFST